MSKPQLFCYTYAGGNASFFEAIEKDLPAFELVKPDYAGHGARRKEPFYRDFTELADDLFARFRAEYAGGEYALFGYSMGAITVAEVLKRILEDPELPKGLTRINSGAFKYCVSLENPEIGRAHV